jgi:hypothetical protein
VGCGASLFYTGGNPKFLMTSNSEEGKTGSLFGDMNENVTIALITFLVIVTTTLFYLGTRYAFKKASLVRVPDREVLKAVYDAGGGPSWDAKYSENWCKNDCKLGEWAGIEAGFANGHEHALEVIMRGNRNFTGLPFM